MNDGGRERNVRSKRRKNEESKKKSSDGLLLDPVITRITHHGGSDDNPSPGVHHSHKPTLALSLGIPSSSPLSILGYLFRHRSSPRIMRTQELFHIHNSLLALGTLLCPYCTIIIRLASLHSVSHRFLVGSSSGCAFHAPDSRGYFGKRTHPFTMTSLDRSSVQPVASQSSFYHGTIA